MILIGAGGMAKDIISFIWNRFDVVTMYDDAIEGREISGTIKDFLNFVAKYKTWGYAMLSVDETYTYNAVGSIGDNGIRNAVYERIKGCGFPIGNVIFPADINRNVIFDGNNIVVGLNSQIHHGCKIGESCVISPKVTLLGDVTLCENVFIGAGAIIKQGLTIGKNAVIGMGSIVLNDISDNETWVGNPARKL